LSFLVTSRVRSSLIGFVVFFAIGLGPFAWLVCAEIFPSRVRGMLRVAARFPGCVVVIAVRAS
jgi:hypothetical protein